MDASEYEAEIGRLLEENQRLEKAIARQAAAVRMHETARLRIEEHDQKTLRSLAGQDRAELLEELAKVREECARWNARATALEQERDDLRAALERPAASPSQGGPRWRRCSQCGCAFYLEDTEPLPEHTRPCLFPGDLTLCKKELPE